jgi:hypothetical protein
MDKKNTISREDVMGIYKQMENNYGEDLPLFVVGMVSQLHSLKTVMGEIEKTAFFSQSSKLTPFKALLHIQTIIKRLHAIPKIDIDNSTQNVSEEIVAPNEKETSNESSTGE